MTEYVALKAKVLTKSSIDIANGSLFEILIRVIYLQKIKHGLYMGKR